MRGAPPCAGLVALGRGVRPAVHSSFLVDGRNYGRDPPSSRVAITEMWLVASVVDEAGIETNLQSMVGSDRDFSECCPQTPFAKCDTRLCGGASISPSGRVRSKPLPIAAVGSAPEPAFQHASD